MSTTVFCKFYELCNVDTIVLTHMMMWTTRNLLVTVFTNNKNDQQVAVHGFSDRGESIVLDHVDSFHTLGYNKTTEMSFLFHKPVDCDEKWFMENVFGGIGAISEFRRV